MWIKAFGGFWFDEMLAIATFAKFTKLSSCKLAFLLYDSYVTQIIIGVAQLIRPRPDAYTYIQAILFVRHSTIFVLASRPWSVLRRPRVRVRVGLGTSFMACNITHTKAGRLQ